MFLIIFPIEKHYIHISKDILNNIDFQKMQDTFTSKYTDKLAGETKWQVITGHHLLFTAVYLKIKCSSLLMKGIEE